MSTTIVNTSELPVLIIVVLFFLAFSLTAQVQLSRSVLANGGAQRSDQSFTVHATIGQLLIGPCANATQQVNGGFWIRISGSTTSAVHTQRSSGLCMRQNVPNPAGDATRVTFSIPRPGLVSLRIHSLNGTEVLRPVHGLLDQGQHDVLIRTQHLPSGTYIYVLQTDTGQLTGKMLIDNNP